MVETIFTYLFAGLFYAGLFVGLPIVFIGIPTAIILFLVYFLVQIILLFRDVIRG